MRSSLMFLLITGMLNSPLPADVASTKIIHAARDQIGKTVRYDPAYVGIEYPGGDIPITSGVCTDVIIRALRSGWKMDLQQLVHEDMRQHFDHYPERWGLKRPDPNIDHRRVPNLMTFFKRRGWQLPHPTRLDTIQPGDLITCLVPPRLDHIMIVSDRRGPSGNYMIIHNIGSGTVEEDRLGDFKITGHFRANP
ncbi:MAG: DUF1287 domain-containing protein [Verrucomicrobiota bacterium]